MQASVHTQFNLIERESIDLSLGISLGEGLQADDLIPI